MISRHPQLLHEDQVKVLSVGPKFLLAYGLGKGGHPFCLVHAAANATWHAPHVVSQNFEPDTVVEIYEVDDQTIDGQYNGEGYEDTPKLLVPLPQGSCPRTLRREEEDAIVFSKVLGILLQFIGQVL